MTEERAQRRLAAIMAADVVGYSRLMEIDEVGTLATLKDRRTDILQPIVSRHRGRIVKLMGDGVLVEFGSAVNAVNCAIELQDAMDAANSELPDGRQIVLRIGINLGDVMVEGSDLYGDGVNIAARLEGIAEPGGICISAKVHEEVRSKILLVCDDVGEQKLKNIATPVRAFQVVRGRLQPSAAAGPQLPAKPSIAVLPLTNMSGDPDQQYFSDGLTEDIITELSRFRQLFVIARNSSFQYRGKDVDVKRVGRELGVQYVVEGSVRKSADRVRITAQLINAETGNHVWAERYDRDLQDIFAVQDEVTQTIVSTLAIRLEDEGLAIAKRKRPESMQAYDFWLHGKNCMDLWTRQANLDARAYFEKAIEADHGFARAYAGLALTYEWATYYSAWGGGDPTLREKAEDLALKAVHLDPTDHVPHLTLAWIYQERRDYEQARRQLSRAEALNPNDADMLINKAMMLSTQGEPEAALDLARSAIRLNPHHPDYYLGYMAHCYFIAGRYEESMALRAGLTRHLPEGRVAVAVLCVLVGRLEEARDHIRKFIADFPSHWIGQPSASFVVDHLFHYKRKADNDMFFDALLKAGLPR